MPQLFLDLHGLGFSVQAGDPGVLEELRRDFAWFDAPAAPPRGLRLELRLERAAPARWGRPALRCRDYAAFDEGFRRRIDYDDGARACWDFALLEGTIECADPVRLRELAYLAVLSRAGEALEARGWHRVHALGFESGGEGGLVVLPCGGGKSTLALELRRRTGFGLLGDDTVWIDPALRLRAFPLRWGFRPEAELHDVPPALVRPFHRKLHGPKRLVDVPYFRDRVADAVPLTRLFIGERGRGPAAVEPLGSGRAFAALFAPLILGVGLAQMTEYTLRLAALGSLARTAARRARRAWEVASGVSCLRLRMGDGPRAARGALESALGDVSRKEELHLGSSVARVGEPELAAGRPGDAMG